MSTTNKNKNMRRVVVVRAPGCGCVVAAHAAAYEMDESGAHDFFEHVRLYGYEMARVDGPVTLSAGCEKCAALAQARGAT